MDEEQKKFLADMRLAIDNAQVWNIIINYLLKLSSEIDALLEK